MTKEGAFRVADKMAWRAWPDARVTCPCGAVVEAADRVVLRHAVRGHLLNCH